eukprot:5255334-Pyramimonas_sp.AAC.1
MLGTPSARSPARARRKILALRASWPGPESCSSPRWPGEGARAMARRAPRGAMREARGALWVPVCALGGPL